jgi:hypothetical protein
VLQRWFTSLSLVLQEVGSTDRDEVSFSDVLTWMRLCAHMHGEQHGSPK